MSNTIVEQDEKIGEQDEEVWLPIARKFRRESKLKYEVSSHGRLRRWFKSTDEWRVISVCIRKNSNRRVFRGVPLARIIGETFLPMHTSDGPMHIDHINRNSSDDRAANLRWLTPMQNAQNQVAPKGYSYDKRRKLYLPTIKCNDKTVWLKPCKTAAEARHIYLAAKKHYHPSCYLTEVIEENPTNIIFSCVIDQPGEIWSEVAKKPYLCYVSNIGRFKRKWATGYRLNKANKVHGRHVVYVKGKLTQLHQLVARAFIDNPNNCKYVRHLDGNYDNNRADNLVWMSAKEKSLRAYSK